MKLRIYALSAALAGVMAVTLAVPAAQALPSNKEQEKCQKTIAKEGGKFLKATLKEKSKCADKNLKTTGSCDFIKRGEKLDKAVTKFRAGLQKSCVDGFQPTFDDEALAVIGFPGKCEDVDPVDGFTGEDLKDCMVDTHTVFADAIYDLEYGSNGDDGVTDFLDRNPANGKDLGKCQKEIAKNGQKLIKTIQKEISKCRDNLIKGKFTGFQATDCGDNPVEVKAGEKIAKAAGKTGDKITDKCPQALFDTGELDVCDEDGLGPNPPKTTTATAAACIVDTHKNVTDDPDNGGGATPFLTDIIDVEYALGRTCGDGIVNEPALPGVFVSGNFFLGGPPEECDGTDDSACPGACGAPSGNFPCLCTDVLRERVIEHDNSDLDNGWTGTSHDSTVVEGAGYVTSLYDCGCVGGTEPGSACGAASDCAGGGTCPNTVCTVGPSCNDAPNAPCVTDATCLGGGNFCRKSPAAMGPRCDDDIQRSCDVNADCGHCVLGSEIGKNCTDDIGQCAGCNGLIDNCCEAKPNFCRKTNHGIPLPLSSGGVAVCVVNIFSEDVVGTTDLATGSSAVRLRQDSVTHIASATVNLPCPSCGGFCSGTSGGAGPGERTTCTEATEGVDCPGSFCVTDKICSFGPNEDMPCRDDGQFGGKTLLFGTPSVDCQPNPGNDISNNGLDILFNPTTTGSLFSGPSLDCGHTGHDFKKCILGTEVGKTCGADSDCAGGGAGSCTFQCFCPVTPATGRSQQANDCVAACHGGTNDYGSCGAASDCPGGVCEENACRETAGVCTGGATIGTACAVDTDCGVNGLCGDGDSSGEGFCASGPVIGLCSFTTLKGCSLDSNCRPSGTCAFCLADESEVCVFKNKDCFPSAGYTRIGTPGTTDRVGVAHFCIPAIGGGSAVDQVAGLAGPGALEQPATLVLSIP